MELRNSESIQFAIQFIQDKNLPLQFHEKSNLERSRKRPYRKSGFASPEIRQIMMGNAPERM
jgi:hypothetical protein